MCDAMRWQDNSNSNGLKIDQIATFSAHGPAADGRIKVTNQPTNQTIGTGLVT
jgi:hypothetical protein